MKNTAQKVVIEIVREDKSVYIEGLYPASITITNDIKKARIYSEKKAIEMMGKKSRASLKYKLVPVK